MSTPERKQLSLERRVAIVTGAARNIGRSIAGELARAGAAVVIADVRASGAEKVAREIRREGREALAVVADVRDRAQVERMVAEAAAHFGGVDILVNNAALLGPRAPAEELSLEQWDMMQEVNLRGAFLCSQAAIPFMKRRRRGKIINISSVVFWVGMGAADYIASKGGLIGLTRGLAREVGRFNINVNAITPGAVKTPEEARLAKKEDVDAIVRSQCLSRRVLPADIARTALFLASDMSDAITGQTINVDAGWAMH